MLKTIELWLFTFGYLAQHIGSGILIYKIRRLGSIDGVCIDTQIIFFIASVCRFIWVFDTRLTALPLVYVELFASVAISVYIVYLCYRLKDLLYVDVSPPFKWPIVIAVCFVLALLFHPGKKNIFSFQLNMQVLVAFSIYLESAGLLPQLFLLRKVGDVGGVTRHYIFSLAISRLIRLFFWICEYMLGNVFFSLMIADFIHCVLLADFTYYYFKSMKSGQPILIFSTKQKQKM